MTQVDPATAPTPAPGARSARAAASSPIAWASAHPGPAALLAGGFLGLVVLMRSRGATPATQGAGSGYYVDPNSANPNDLLGSTEGEIANLAQQLAATPSTPSVWAPPMDQVPYTGLPGAAGFGPNPQNMGVPVVDRAGNTYQSLASWPAAFALLQQGQTLYWQPNPGTFQPFTMQDYQTIGTGGPQGAQGFSAQLFQKVAGQ